jgi:hypothetical protein
MLVCALVALLGVGATVNVADAQTYECTTTTHTYIKKVYWSDGRVDIYIWSDSVTVCIPLNEA